MSDTTNTSVRTERGEKRKAAPSLVDADLRDYFAAKAMQGQLSYGDCADMSAAGVAKFAYEVADAMLAERENQS